MMAEGSGRPMQYCTVMCIQMRMYKVYESTSAASTGKCSYMHIRFQNECQGEIYISHIVCRRISRLVLKPSVKYSAMSNFHMRHFHARKRLR